MSRLRQHHRWAPWWVAALFGILYLPLGYAVILAIVDPAKGGEGIRIFLPMFSIFTYWVLALVLNMRTAVVTPAGVSVRLLPFPIGNGQKIKRADIAVCYCRHIIEYEDGQEIENFHTAGVETKTGQQIDVYIPIETEAGWLVLSHGVGAMRKYCLGAFLLDLKDPSRVIGRLRQPLLSANEAEREGYVPNVVYTCGAMLHDRELIIPYAMSDSATSFASVSLDDLLQGME